MNIEARYYNNDPRYEMMLAILPELGENLPDSKEILADLKEIVRLCHHYTIDDDTPNERAAWELAHAIINHLLLEWGTHKVGDLGVAAKEYWAPPSDGVSTTYPIVDTPQGMQDGVGTADTIGVAPIHTPEDGTAKGVHTVDPPEEKGLTTADTPQGMQNAHTPDDGLLIP